jgi:hypothetical protein
MVLAAPAGAVVPYFSRLAAQERGRVKITDVKVIRIRMKGHVMPLVKIETDAGVNGIGECHLRPRDRERWTHSALREARFGCGA